jgi:hypothetical protein
MKGLPQKSTHEARNLLIFDVGSAVHGMLQEYGAKGAWGPHYEKEVDIGSTQLAQSLRIEGHCDADNILIIDELPGMPIYEVGVVHEYKTINNNGFESLKNRPKPQHKIQAMVYSACLNRPIVAFLYMNKDNCNIADFPVAFEMHMWEQLHSKLVKLNYCFDTGTEAPADVGYHCQQCGYIYDCEAYKAAKKK